MRRTICIPNLPDHSSLNAKNRQEYHRLYTTIYKSRFKWIRANLFHPSLQKELTEDALALTKILEQYGTWNPKKDAKLNALEALLTETHRDEKVLVFTQFADTAQYLTNTLSERGVKYIATATGDSADPTALAHSFSPVSNDKRSRIKPADELVLVSTDVLSEGHNLQDCAIVGNYDLPWAIIRLVQHAGRVDRKDFAQVTHKLEKKSLNSINTPCIIRRNLISCYTETSDGKA